MTLTALEKQISDLIPTYSRGQVKKFAKRVQHLCNVKQTPSEFIYYLKTYGIYSDPTAYQALQTIMKET